MHPSNTATGRHLAIVSDLENPRKEHNDVHDEAILSAWASHAKASGYRPRTIKEHLISLNATLRRTEKNILNITRYDLIADLARDGISPSTISRYKSLFHGFWTWVQDEGFRLDNPATRLPRVRVPKNEPNPVTTEDLELLINSGIYAKTRMYVLLYAYQGFRASEIAAVSGEAIDWTSQRILSVDGKGGKEVWRPLHPLVWDEAQKYPRTGWWFPSPHSGTHVTGRNVSNVLSQAMKRAGIVGHRPHNLRGWFATEMSASGAPTAVVAAALRHSDMQSVTRYLAVHSRDIDEAQQRLPQVNIPTESRRALAA